MPSYPTLRATSRQSSCCEDPPPAYRREAEPPAYRPFGDAPSELGFGRMPLRHLGLRRSGLLEQIGRRRGMILLPRRGLSPVAVPVLVPLPGQIGYHAVECVHLPLRPRPRLLPAVLKFPPLPFGHARQVYLTV